VKFFHASLSAKGAVSRIGSLLLMSSNEVAALYDSNLFPPSDAPAGLTGTAGNREISLSWLLTPGAASYNLLCSTDNGATYQPLATGLTTSSYVDTNAVNGQMNYYEVAASDSCGAGATSAAVGIFLPLPALGMSVSANAMAISWPGWANDWSLYATTNLTPPVVWTAVTNTATGSNGAFNVTLPIGLGIQFYRLGSP
jgi:hypothetical protein